MFMQWGQVFAFPFRRPTVMFQLWLLHLLPIVAMIPFFISGALTFVTALVTEQHQALRGATLAMGVGTLLAYLFFVAVALFVGLYPLGYLVEVASSVAHQHESKPLPMGRWLVRAAKGLYAVLIVYAGAALPSLPVLLVFEPSGHPMLRILLFGAVMIGWIVALSFLPIRLAHSLNPFSALNPLGILGDLRRGWLDYLVMMVGCTALYCVFVASYMATFILAPFFLGAGPVLMLLSVFFGMAQSYFLLVCAQAAGQFARLYSR